MKIYTTTETAEILQVSDRTVRTYCQMWNVPKLKRSYQITDEHITAFKNHINEEINEIILAEIKANDLKALQYEKVSLETEVQIQKKLVQQANERLRSLDEVILQFKNELAKYDLQPNERLEVFTNDEYQILEQRLREWHEHDKKILHQEELFNVEKASLKEILTHYKKQFKYQKKQSERILLMHQRLIDEIAKQNKLAIQRQIIEASEKDIIDEDWKPKKRR